MKSNLLIFFGCIILMGSCCSQHQFHAEKLSGEVKSYRGKTVIFINGKPVEPMIYALTSCPGGRWSWDEMPQYSIKRFRDVGFTLYQGELWMRDIFPVDKDSLDIEMVKRQIRGFVQANPKAAVFIRLRCNSSPAWNRKNREECVQWTDTQAVDMEKDGLHRWDDNDTENSLRYSLASKKWRDDMVKKIEILCRELSKTQEGNAVVGIQMATGVFGENHYWGFLDDEPDISKPMQIHFREWLKKKYRTDEALRKAWNDEKVTLSTARVPGMKERFPDDLDGIFRNPRTNRQMIDYSQCQHELVVDNLLLFCKTAKKNWPRPLITGTFYGYTFNCFGRHAAGGHCEMERMLTSPYIDYLSGPMTYLSQAREIGGSGHSRGIVEECMRYGKIWLDEYDQSTSLHPLNMGEYLSPYTKNLEEDKAIIRRSIASTYTRGGGRWFYDFGPRTIGGWWNDSILLNDIGKLKKIFEKYGQKPFFHEADVLAVYDPEVFYYLGHNWDIDPITHTGVEWGIVDLFQSGVSFDMCYLFDLGKIDLSKYKVILFVNTFKLTGVQRDLIKSKVEKEGRTVIWNYMPGYTNGDDLNEGFVKELVQMDLKKVTMKNNPPTVVLDNNHEIQYFVGSNQPPIFKIIDKNAKPMAHLKKDGYTVIASKKQEKWTSVFCSLPLQNENIMRKIFEEAGCHIYTDSGDVLQVGGGILVVHTKNGGRRVIHLRNGKSVELNLPPKNTTILDNETGNILLQ